MPEKLAPVAEGWTINTALQHLLSLVGANDHRYEQRFKDLEQFISSAMLTQKDAVSAALAAADRAVQKAETASEKRFDAVNEFRETLADQQRNLMPRSEVDVLQRAQAEKISSLEAAVTQKLGSLEKQFDAMQAEQRGVKGGYGYAVGIVGFLLTLITLGVLVMKTFRP